MNPSPQSIEVLFSPTEFASLPERDLRGTVCVVFDVLRATSTMMAALASGAAAIYPVAEIAEALALRATQPDLLLAGERHGLRIRAAEAGSVDFDFGNSPGEFTTGGVQGRSIAMTTTNGTRALRACRGAGVVLIGSFSGLTALADWIVQNKPRNLLIVCSGTGEQTALEDVLGAGALCDRLAKHFGEEALSDSASMSRELFRRGEPDLLQFASRAKNARRLLALPGFEGDVAICLTLDRFSFVAVQNREGVVTKL